MHAGPGRDGAGMSRVRLSALDLPAVEEEPCGRSVRQQAGVVRGRVALIQRPKPGKPAPPEVLFIDAASMGTADERAQRVLREDEIAKIVQEYRGWHHFSRWRNLAHSGGFARSAAIEEIRQNDYNLQPRRYVREQTSSRSSLADAPSAGLEALLRQLDELTERAKRARLDIGTRLKTLHDSTAGEWSEVPLGRICGIQAGPGTVKREHGLTVQGWTPIVLPRNIRRSHLSHDALDTVRPEISAKLVN